MKLKGPLARQTLAKKLGVSVNTLRHQEGAGRFNPTKKKDETGRPIVMYPDAEIKKAFEFYHKKDFNYSTEWKENG